MRANVANRPQNAFVEPNIRSHFQLDFCPKERKHGLKISRSGEKEGQ